MKKIFYRLQQKLNNIPSEVKGFINGVLIIYGCITIITFVHNAGDDLFDYCEHREAINRIHSALIHIELPIRKTACWLFLPYEE